MSRVEEFPQPLGAVLRRRLAAALGAGDLVELRLVAVEACILLEEMEQSVPGGVVVEDWEGLRRLASAVARDLSGERV